MKLRVLVVVVSVFACLNASVVAYAAEEKPEVVARAHFQDGEAHFAAGRFAEALVEYEAGYDAVPLPGFLVNIAQCQRRLGHLKPARIAYEKFVLVTPDSPLVPEIRGLIRELDRSIAEDATQPLNESPAVPPPSAPTREPSMTPPPLADLNQKGESASLKGADLTFKSEGGSPSETTPSHKARWFIVGSLAALAVGGIALAFALKSPGTTLVHEGSLGTLRR